MVSFKDLTNALACANAAIDGTAGGYTHTEKEKAKNLLVQVETDLVSRWRKTSCDPDKVSVKLTLMLAGK